MVVELGIEVLIEEQYRDLQNMEIFNTKTSSWINTPIDIRKLGGDIFANYRYAIFSYIITVQNLTMPPEVFVVAKRLNFVCTS